MREVHIGRLHPGTPFIVGDEEYTMIRWHECSATVSERKPDRLVQLTDRYGNEREFLAKRGKTVRIASDIYVYVDKEAKLRTCVIAE